MPPKTPNCHCKLVCCLCAGTVITEWDDGAAVWSTVLSSRDTIQQLVSNLVAICKYHDFDGWLVNIENKIEVTFCRAGVGWNSLVFVWEWEQNIHAEV